MIFTNQYYLDNYFCLKFVNFEEEQSQFNFKDQEYVGFHSYFYVCK